MMAEAASWVEFADKRQRFTMRRVDPSGAMSAPIVIGGDGSGRVSGYPRMARTGDELVFAWTESAAGSKDGESAQQIKGAVARLPRPTAPNSPSPEAGLAQSTVWPGLRPQSKPSAGRFSVTMRTRASFG